MQQAEAATPDPEYQAARTALEARRPAYWKARRDSDVAAAEAAASKMEEEAGEAQYAMFETTPTSRGGALALLRRTADHLDAIGVNDSLLEDIFTDAIRNAVAVLEGEA